MIELLAELARTALVILFCGALIAIGLAQHDHHDALVSCIDGSCPPAASAQP